MGWEIAVRPMYPNKNPSWHSVVFATVPGGCGYLRPAEINMEVFVIGLTCIWERTGSAWKTSLSEACFDAKPVLLLKDSLITRLNQ